MGSVLALASGVRANRPSATDANTDARHGNLDLGVIEGLAKKSR